MDLTNIKEMTFGFSVWWSENVHSLCRDALKNPSNYGVVMRVVPGVAPADSYMVETSHLAQAMKWRHCNLLRVLKSYHAKHPNEKGLYFNVSGSQTRNAVLWVPTLQRFIVWLLNSLKGHQASQARRYEEFKTTLGFWSGLTSEQLDDLPGSLCLPSEWCMEFDALTWEQEFKHQAELDFHQDVVKQEGRMTVISLAHACGYSTKHMALRIRNSHSELGTPGDEFLTISQDMSVSRKTALYMLLMLPKTTRVRLQIFNAMFERLQVKPAPQFPALPDYLPVVDFSDPNQVVQAIQLMCDRQTELDSRMLTMTAEHTQEKLEVAGQLNTVKAELAGREYEIASLKHAIATSVAAGSIVQNNEADQVVVSSHDLRTNHGYVTINDVLKTLLISHPGEDLADMLAPVDKKGGIWETIRRILRFSIAEKLLNSDGCPRLRPGWVQAGHVCAKRVFTSSNSSAGNRASHGQEQFWRWSVFYTPAGVKYIVAHFGVLVAAFLDAGQPNHMVELDKVPV